MNRLEFDTIIQDIEDHLEKTEGYELFFRMNSGGFFRGSWKWLSKTPMAPIIVISQDDEPLFYTSLSAIESIQLSDG